MSRRASSPRLIGRERELADLLAAVAADDRERPVILLAGEAGIGKTRLLAELADHARPGVGEGTSVPLFARGSCLRFAEGELPFAPVLEILDGLRAELPPETFEGLRARLKGGRPEGLQAPATRTLLFIEIHDALVTAAGGRRLVVILDDAHWADQSTLDLVLFLARRLRGGPVVLLVAYRSDELHRRHPLRPVVAELSHGYVRDRIELGPLDSASVEEQVAELAADLSDDRVAAIRDRADGNPFYVEELVALDPAARELPASVRGVLLARIAGLEAETVRVLSACAAAGHEVDLDLLTSVLDTDEDAVLAAVRDAIEHAVLMATQGGYRYRHALLEEAVLDDLLPAERVGLHRRIAGVLQTRIADAPDSVAPGELACQLDLGGQPGPAIAAYLDAAERAFRALAWTEGVAAYERAAELAATGLADLDGTSLTRLRASIVPTAMAMDWSGSPARSIALLRQGAAEAEADGDSLAAATMLVPLARILFDVGDEAGAWAAHAAAVALHPPTEDTVVGVDLLLNLASATWNEGRTRLALGYAERGLRGAESLGDPVLLFRALIHRAEMLITLGRLAEGVADVDRARGLQDEHGWLDISGLLAINIGAALTDVGLLDQALELLQEGVRRGRELGIERSWDPWNLPGLAYLAVLSGRWSEADSLIEGARTAGARGLAMYEGELAAALLAAGRGDIAACDRALDRSTEGAAGMGLEVQGIIGLGKAARADAVDDPAAKLEAAEAGLRALEDLDTFVARSRLAVEIAAAAADVASTLPPRHRKGIEAARARARAAANLARDIDAARVVEGTASVPWTRANVALAAAEAARACEDDSDGDWLAVASEFRAMGMVPRVAYAEYRAAAAAIRRGNRPAAASILRDSRSLAAGIGMTVLLRRVDALARAARLDLATAPPEATPAERRADPWGLSSREREVLSLLVEGRTNGEIGARLFISTKTASVHVTHILDKLGVSSRTEAALLASRAGILDADLRSGNTATI